MERAVGLFEDPRMCGIVLLRKECTADIEAILSLTAGNENPTLSRMASFARTGDIDTYDPKWADANVVIFPEGLWKTDPRSTWLEAAGVLLQSHYGVDSALAPIFNSPTYMDVARHADQAGPYGALVSGDLVRTSRKATSQSSVDGLPTTSAALNMDQLQRLSTSLVPQLTALFPPQARPSVSIGQSFKGDMQLGVFVSCASEMFESPTLFLQPSSQEFLSALSSQLADVQSNADNAQQARAMSQGFLAADSPDAWKKLYKDFQRSSGQALASLPGRRKSAFIAGMFAAQLAYNAAILHDAAAARQQLGALVATPSDLNVPGFAEKRDALKAVPAGDWHALNRIAAELTLTIAE